jgi:xanthine dehydrogenase molybdopterin-binding subunit B
MVQVANASPSAASLSTDLYGQATLNACEEIRKRLEPIARALRQPGGAPPTFQQIATAAYFQAHYLRQWFRRFAVALDFLLALFGV